MAWEGSQGATTIVNSGGTGGDVPSTDQSRKRSYAIYTDQHGRRWGASIENKTGDPCGPLEPHHSWANRAPVIPDISFISINSQQRQFFIRYEDIIRDLDEANRMWDEELRKTAVKMYGAQAAKAIAEPPPELLDIVGPRPNGRREVWEAALAGNKWILGLAEKKPAWAYEYFPTKPETPEAPELILSGKYPDADEEAEEPAADLLSWSGPTRGWKIVATGEYVERLDGETSEDHKARALALAAEE